MSKIKAQLREDVAQNGASFADFAELQNRWPVSRRTIHRAIEEGRLPKLTVAGGPSAGASPSTTLGTGRETKLKGLFNFETLSPRSGLDWGVIHAHAFIAY
ncbi:MAG: hypothetical protein ACLPWS_04245 [Rhodomicrobium sp.]